MTRIKFTEIPEEGLQVNVKDVSWFPDQEMARCGDPKVVVFLKRSGAQVLLRSTIEVVLAAHCDRCLEEFVSPQKIDFQLVLEVSDSEEDSAERDAGNQEIDLGESEVLALDGPIVDLNDLLYQQMILSIPQKYLCRSDCQGICRRCGINLNFEHCRCSDNSEGSPFGSLHRLLKN